MGKIQEVYILVDETHALYTGGGEDSYYITHDDLNGILEDDASARVVMMSTKQPGAVIFDPDSYDEIKVNSEVYAVIERDDKIPDED
ncbi:MAG: hypothetical protein BWY90_00107 [Deltaproteobacteria bacterium ADurb.BinA014]|nr:MAG: hypothetical protein BWY90_00107 [Deltaproteobacteria bacterium ADurb.BinA014]